jgi:ABC-type glycerol-3-phosphate transport system substrate-binding protein/DNA-binding transcriptional regulator YhcF (GntR family)
MAGKQINLSENTTLVDQVATIIMGDLKKAAPGDKILPERGLAEKYKVSRKTAREAVSRLTGEGLLERRVGKGTFVSSKVNSHKERPVSQLIYAEAFPFSALEDSFEKINKNGEILNPSFFYGDYRAQDLYFYSIKNAARSGKGQDLISVDEGLLPVFAEEGLLYPLDEFFEKSSIDKGLIHPSVLDAFRYKGKLYGAPQTFLTNALFYNKKMFKEQGLSFPDSSWKWSDLQNAAEKLTITDTETGRNRSFGIGFFHFSVNVLLSFVCQNLPAELDLASLDFFDRPETVEAFRFLHDMVHKDKLCPFFQNDLFLSPSSMFVDEKIAMFIGSYNNCHEVKCDFDWGIAELPSQKRKFLALPVQGWALSSSAPDKKKAFSILEQYLQESVADSIAKKTKRISAVNGHNNKKIPRAFLDSLEFAKPGKISFPPTIEIRKDYQREVCLLFNNFCSPEEFCEKMSKHSKVKK